MIVIDKSLCLCKKMPNTFYMLSSYHIGTSPSTPTRILSKLCFRKLIWQLWIDQDKSLRKNSARQDLQISSIPFRDIGIGRLKNNLTFDMIHYLTGHALHYDHKGACKKRTHLRGIFSIDKWQMAPAEATEAKIQEAKKELSSQQLYFENNNLSL